MKKLDFGAFCNYLYHPEQGSTIVYLVEKDGIFGVENSSGVCVCEKEEEEKRKRGREREREKERERKRKKKKEREIERER